MKYGDIVNKEKVVVCFKGWNDVFYNEYLIAQELDELGFNYFAIDIDKNPELSKAINIKRTPTFIVYKKGQTISRVEENFTDFIELLKEGEKC